ncbi:mitotic-spindle organizing protein 2B-like [Indicator indicator]|uniref:mitotic-spindle organizing protein 2B-like n=1 Tax=Indicator indicator TaxID=1002788 RepID=UPI0023E00086|nr:mitotic-spindle organizing protein 2B-like [Indicator indicator]
MSEAAAGGMAAVMVEARLRRKQLLSSEEAELFELAQAAGSGLDPEVFRVVLDLLRMNVAPLAVFQVLKSMCAGQRLPPAPEAGPVAPAPLPADTRGRNKSNSGASGSQALAERSGREGSAQRMPRQPSSSRMQKAAAPGKSSGGGSSS